MSATLGDLLLAKAVSCAISVVKANHVQGGAATNCVRREVSAQRFLRKTEYFRTCTNSVYQASPRQGVGLDKPSVYDTMCTEA